MELKYDIVITGIGNLAKAFLAGSNSVILMDEGVRPNLSEMVVEHTPGELTEDIQVGDKLLIGGGKFSIIKVGDQVNANLRQEGHCTIIFNAEGTLPGQMIVKGTTKPVLSEGAHISIEKKASRRTTKKAKTE